MATEGKKISQLTEVLSVDKENDYIIVQRGTDNKKLKLANVMTTDNMGDNYVDLKSYEDKSEFRLIINDDGKVQVFPKECVEDVVAFQICLNKCSGFTFYDRNSNSHQVPVKFYKHAQ